MGVVINQDAIIDENVTIQHHVTIGKTDKGVPHIRGGLYWSKCYCYRKGRHWK